MMDDEIAALARQAIADRIFPGCVVGVVAGGGQSLAAFGHPTYESTVEVEAGSVYDVASLTKTIVTATLVHLLIDEGRCALTDPVCRYIPEFAAGGKEQVRIEHLLSFTLELSTAYYDDWKGDTSLWTFPQLLQLFYAAPLTRPPGERYLYTDVTAMLLGELIRRVAGVDLDELARERIFVPLGMRDSTLDPAALPKERIVPTGFRPDGRLIWAVPNDEKAEIAYASGIQSGLAGLFSTVPDILRWVAMMLDGGRANGRPFLSERAVCLMTRDYYPDKPFRSALGWGDGPTHLALDGSVGGDIVAKGGYTGCFMVGDIAVGKAVVCLANRVHPHRPDDLRPWQAFRQRVVASVFGPAPQR